MYHVLLCTMQLHRLPITVCGICGWLDIIIITGWDAMSVRLTSKTGKTTWSICPPSSRFSQPRYDKYKAKKPKTKNQQKNKKKKTGVKRSDCHSTNSPSASHSMNGITKLLENRTPTSVLSCPVH